MEAVRTLVAVGVVVLLLRAGRQAWRARDLAVRVWASIRPRHVLGSLALLGAVAGVAWALLTFVPPTRYGLGSLIGLTGNVVFAPVEEVGARTGSGPVLLAVVGGFFAVLLALFPFLAFAEERTFRAGLEHATPAREALVALRFGLVHLVMLVPIAAALAIALAGWVYGRIYRRAYARADLPPPARRATALLAATTWHTTFNSVLVMLVWVSLLLA
jgi:hypothetical protein